MDEPLDAQKLYEENLGLIRSIARFVCRRRKVGPEDQEEFESYVHIKLIENDYRIFRHFENRSSLKTYLTVVVQRLFLDFLDGKWGRFRPSAAAKRLGPAALRLEELMFRDGYSFDEAAETLATNHGVELSRDRLFAIAEQLPRRSSRRAQPIEPLRIEDLPKHDLAERPLRQKEANRLARSAEAAFEVALRELEAEDRLILKMRFREGLTVPQISSTLDLETRRLYRRIERDLTRLRASIESHGLTFQQVTEAMTWGDFSIRDDSKGF